MRGFLTSSIGVTCAGALVLPWAAQGTLAGPASAGPASAGPADTGPASASPADTGPAAASPAAADAVAGSTRSLPLVPLSPDRDGGAPDQGLFRSGVRHFSLVGVVWDDPDRELRGQVQVRTRSVTAGTWSAWQDVDPHNGDHGADPGTAERTSRGVRGATAPLWVGSSDGVDVRVRADADARTAQGRAKPPRSPLPSGLRLELVDPGHEAPTTASPAEIPELNRQATEGEMSRLTGELPRGKPHIGPRPKIVTRRGWGADESLRERGFVYTKKVKAAFVHHTDSGNTYTCAQAPSVVRGIYRYHVKSMGWRDIGYNFLVDKCGILYEGRAGGVTKAVLGAHTLGFNSNSTGIAVLGSYGSAKPSSAAVKAIARLTAWKLGLYGVDPRGKTYLTSGGGNLYPKGKNVRLNVISGHRDGYATDCPGKRLYAKLGSARSSAAAYQGR
ncbi:peptidoglycan recognition protein [Streptomyces sp. NPDC048297]|uniref:peptidoglycan recognition protein family protein n=1 Tax=Streptomyces sp. NPDC048297 TaxID=3365531 RepID=UPI003712E3CE